MHALDFSEVFVQRDVGAADIFALGRGGEEFDAGLEDGVERNAAAMFRRIAAGQELVELGDQVFDGPGGRGGAGDVDGQQKPFR